MSPLMELARHQLSVAPKQVWAWYQGIYFRLVETDIELKCNDKSYMSSARITLHTRWNLRLFVACGFARTDWDDHQPTLVHTVASSRDIRFPWFGSNMFDVGNDATKKGSIVWCLSDNTGRNSELSTFIRLVTDIVMTQKHTSQNHGRLSDLI